MRCGCVLLFFFFGVRVVVVIIFFFFFGVCVSLFLLLGRVCCCSFSSDMWPAANLSCERIVSPTATRRGWQSFLISWQAPWPRSTKPHLCWEGHPERVCVDDCPAGPNEHTTAPVNTGCWGGNLETESEDLPKGRMSTPRWPGPRWR